MKKLRLFDSLKLVLATVACVFAIMPAHAATLPAGYTELEYLQTDGNSWIDTGIKGDMSYKYEIDFQQLDAGQYRNWGAFDQSRYSGGPNMSLTYMSGFAVRWTVSGNSDQAVNLSSLDSNRHHIIIDNGYVTWDGVNKGRSTGHQDNYVFGYNLFLGTINPGGNTPTSNAKSKYYSYKVWNTSGDLIQNFIPARRDSDGVLGMYDLADANPATAFHTNAGTGEFVAGPAVSIKIATTHYNETKFAPVETRLDAAVAAVDTVVTQTMNQAQAIDQIANEKQTRPDEGCTAKYCLLVEDEDGTPHWYPIAGANGVAHALPAGYTELQYIESTGTQYINTGIVTQNGIGFDVTFLTNNSTVPNESRYGAILGGRQSTGNNDFQITTYTPVGSTMGTIRNGSSSPVISAKISTNTKLHISLINDVITYDDGTTSPVSSYEYTTGKNIYLFGLNNNDSFVQSGAGCRIYNAKLLVGSNVVFDGIPAKQGTTVGMYDLVSGHFFTNAGTGTFTAGPDM